MRPEEWKSYSDKEKSLFRKGYRMCLDDVTQMDIYEKGATMEKLDEYLKALEEL